MSAAFRAWVRFCDAENPPTPTDKETLILVLGHLRDVTDGCPDANESALISLVADMVRRMPGENL